MQQPARPPMSIQDEQSFSNLAKEIEHLEAILPGGEGPRAAGQPAAGAAAPVPALTPKTGPFRVVFYNEVKDIKALAAAGRPADFDETLWAEAQRANPEPDRLWPVQGFGFGDLEKRLDALDRAMAAGGEAVKATHRILAHMKETRFPAMRRHAEHARERNATQIRRLTDLLAKIEVLEGFAGRQLAGEAALPRQRTSLDEGFRQQQLRVVKLLEEVREGRTLRDRIQEFEGLASGAAGGAGGSAGGQGGRVRPTTINLSPDVVRETGAVLQQHQRAIAEMQNVTEKVTRGAAVWEDTYKRELLERSQGKQKS